MNLIVFGDLMLDKYTNCKISKINSECPNIVFDYCQDTLKLGGASNVCNNLTSLDVTVFVLSVIGKDSYSDNLIKLLEEKKNNTDYIIKNNKPTILKHRYICNNTQVFRIDTEYTEPINLDIQEQLFKNFNKIVTNNEIDGLLISDYDKGVVVPELTKRIISICCLKNIPVFVDPKISNFEKYKYSTVLKPNRDVFNQLCKYYQIENNLSLETFKIIADNLNLKYLLVTLDKDGMMLYDTVNSTITQHNIGNMENNVVDVTGAGDTVLSSLVHFYLKDKDIDQAVQKANIIGSYSVTISGCFVLNKTFLKEKFNKSKILDKKDLDLIDKNKKIVFTNGCFDILHSGHLEYLQKSKVLGDILIVGLNSDDSIKRLKGDKRPINLELDRAKLLSGLECVDYVIIFNEDTPYNLIKEIGPDIIVKGADYKKEEVVGNDLVDEVLLMNYKSGYSTSNIIEKLITHN
jgi:D-beta-D-heptose 7-phosphate kinase/D-beta-D-heptose 1-phosphate adenosyltransferase